MKYPEYVRINNKKVKINTDYRYALKALRVCDDVMIGDYERAMAVCFIMYNFVPPASEFGEYLSQAIKFLQCGEEIDDSGDTERDMDLIEDEKYINVSFMSDYGIDLSRTDMHFWKYCELITGFTEKSIMSRIRQIRNCDPNDYAEKDRRAIYKAKEAVELPTKYTREELEAMAEFEAHFK